MLPLHITIPQTFFDIVDLLQTCRDRTHAALFPRIVEIWPQPSAAWGALLAVPDWQDRTPVICVDCTALDGRLFAAVAPTRVNRHQLLQIAGLSPVAEAEVFLPDNMLPLEADEDVALWTGLCVRLTHRGHFPPTDLSLREMLRGFGQLGQILTSLALRSIIALLRIMVSELSAFCPIGLYATAQISLHSSGMPLRLCTSSLLVL